MKKILFICLSLLVLSCNGIRKDKAVKDDTDNSLSRYVYVDKAGCVHASKECEVLDTCFQISFVDTSEIRDARYFCSKCINNERFEHLHDIINRNQNGYVSEEDIRRADSLAAVEALATEGW